MKTASIVIANEASTTRLFGGELIDYNPRALPRLPSGQIPSNPPSRL